MKKVVAYTLLFFYMSSGFKPFVPAVFNYISKTFWEISHRNHVKNMTGRVNLLVELADMAKHNNPKPSNAPQPDSVKQSSGSLCVVPKFNYVFSFNRFSEKLFSHYFSSAGVVFLSITAPPPKAA